MWAPVQPAAGTFFGACQASTGPGSCKPTASCTTGTAEDNLCPGGSGIKCCPDGGPSFIAGIDLPGGFGVEVSSATGVTANTMACLKASTPSVSFIVARGWQSTCQIDRSVVTTLASAATAGLSADVTLFPAFWCGMSPKAQALQLLSTLADSTYGRIWISVEAGAGWSTINYADNLAWIQSAADTIASSIGGARVGIVSSPAGWTTVTNNIAAPSLAVYPLYYQGSAATTFTDYTQLKFGPFAYPYVKRYANAVQQCGVTVNQLWLPTKSANAAAPGAAPTPEATGAACASNGSVHITRATL